MAGEEVRGEGRTARPFERLQSERRDLLHVGLGSTHRNRRLWHGLLPAHHETGDKRQ